MKHTTATGLLVLSLSAPSFLVQSLAGARAARPEAATAALENGTLSLRFPEPGSAILTNKLTGKSYALSTEPFVLQLEIAGNRFRAAAGDSLLAATENISPTLLRLRYDGVGGKEGLAVFVDYELGEPAWYVRKRVTVVNGLGENVVIHDATVDDVGFPQGALPAKAQNPVFVDGQVFWGMEWPIAEAAIQDGRFRLTHFPAAAVVPGGSWTSKTTGFGVSASDRIEEAFGRYIQAIRANRVDFATFYFDWLCHDNSGPLESEILANFAALKRLREMYGLQFDIYNSDAGLVESQGTYFPQFKARFDQRFPNGLRTIASPDGLSGKDLCAPKDSKSSASLVALNGRLKSAGKPPAVIRAIPGSREDDDVLEMVNANLIPITESAKRAAFDAERKKSEPPVDSLKKYSSHSQLD